MADDPPNPGPPLPGSGWPYQPADHDRPPTPPAGPRPWASEPPVRLVEPSAPLAGSPPVLVPRQKPWLLVVAVAVAVLLAGAVTVVFLATREVDDVAVRPSGRGGVPTPQAPVGTVTDLRLLAGRVVLTAQPGWVVLDSTPHFASVRLLLQEPTGRVLLSTMSIVTLSGPGSLDDILIAGGGTSFEVAGADGPLRVTARPGSAARVVAGAVRPRATFFVNVSLFSTDGQDVDVPTLRTIFTEQVAPALRFP